MKQVIYCDLKCANFRITLFSVVIYTPRRSLSSAFSPQGLINQKQQCDKPCQIIHTVLAICHGRNRLFRCAPSINVVIPSSSDLMIPKAFFTFFLLVYRMMANSVSYFIFDMTVLITVPEKASLNPPCVAGVQISRSENEHNKGSLRKLLN